MDILCVILPAFTLRNLKVSRKEKLALFVVLGLGVL